jgi:DNA-binding NtrC family response regulator
VVEDDFIIAMELETILADAGAQVVGPCRTVNEALAAVRERKVAAAILDVRLGGETIAPVAAELTRRGVPFLFYTGQVETDQLRAEWPGRAIISKPAPAGNIISAVACLWQR